MPHHRRDFGKSPSIGFKACSKLDHVTDLHLYSHTYAVFEECRAASAKPVLRLPNNIVRYCIVVSDPVVRLNFLHAFIAISSIELTELNVRKVGKGKRWNP